MNWKHPSTTKNKPHLKKI